MQLTVYYCPSQLISDATVPCEIEHSLYSYKFSHQNKQKHRKWFY